MNLVNEFRSWFILLIVILRLAYRHDFQISFALHQTLKFRILAYIWRILYLFLLHSICFSFNSNFLFATPKNRHTKMPPNSAMSNTHITNLTFHHAHTQRASKTCTVNVDSCVNVCTICVCVYALNWCTCFVTHKNEFHIELSLWTKQVFISDACCLLVVHTCIHNFM